MFGPFEKVRDVNPVLTPNRGATFMSPMNDTLVRWEEYSTFNPAAVVKDGKVYVLYRAEDATGDAKIGGHTSRIGLAESRDGLRFTRRSAPVLYPDKDAQRTYEWLGGVEDPRVVETDDGTYVLTYTQWNKDVPRLAVATSKDLVNWTKHGPAFAKADSGKHLRVESKSGAILSRVEGNRVIATKVNGKYWMYFNVPDVLIATSENLIDWTPITDENGKLLKVLSPRPGYFDSWLVEAGPPAIMTEHGIVVLYNAGNSEKYGDPRIPHRTYTGGQALFDRRNPLKLIARTDEPFIRPTEDYERTGQYVEGTTFVEGLVPFNGRWYLYYGMADSRVGVAVWDPRKAQLGALMASDSALVGRILLAEDRRDSLAPALTEGMQHADARVRTLARRARGRIVDPVFAERDSLPRMPAPASWPEPSWRQRYRALAEQRPNCGALRAALGDSVWPVRLRAADLTPAECASDDQLAEMLRQWIDALPSTTTRRRAGGVSWHAGAHALVAFARVSPRAARPRVAKLASHVRWEVRAYAARAAAVLSDTTRLRMLARDRNDNVKEIAIDALSKLTGHGDDELFLAALDGQSAQAVRAAAIALKGSPRADVAGRALAAFEGWVARGSESERDVRVALLEAAGQPASADRPPSVRAELPPRAVALALGEDVRLRVTMAGASGGGSFVVRLRGDVAPIMAARVLELARNGYYNATMWHRVEHDFVIQGGGPGANEYIGHRRYFRDELGTVPHARGTVGMSTRGHDTGDAQWFINLKDNLRLNRDYTVFAEVVEGIDVVDGVLEGDVIAEMREVPKAVPPRSR